MIPSTGMTAILLCESLSSTTASSSRGPAWRAALTATSPRRTWRALKRRLSASRIASSTTATFQPEELRVRGGGVFGGARTKGGGTGVWGGGVGLLSILEER